MKLKPILVKSNSPIILGSICEDPTFGLGVIISESGEDCFYSIHHSGGSVTTPWERNLGHRLKHVDIILIDTEAEIVEDDLFIDTKTGVVHIASDTHDTWDNEFKIISSTNKEHNLTLLSPNSIQLLINHYNEHGEMPENIEVEQETIQELIKGRSWDENWEKWPNGERPFYMKDVIKLNQQGEIDITIHEVEEKVYTEDEVWTLCLRAYHLGGMEEHAPKVSITKWFDKNKK